MVHAWMVFVLHLLAIVTVLGWGVNWLLHIGAIAYGLVRLHKKVQPGALEELPGVSIIKPLVGVDPHLFENIESFFNMKYPKYELLFCIQDDMDASIMIVQSLVQKYPSVDAKVFIGGRKIGVNPKVNNMIVGYEAAKYELVMVSDSGLKMKEDSLMDMVLCMTDRVGMVHQMPYICDRKGFSSNVEKIFFGTQQAKMYLVANMLGINCTTGMSCLMRRSVVEEAGGLTFFGQFLAEDYLLAQAFLQRGYLVKISSQTAMQNSGYFSIPHFHARLVRWTKLRIATIPTTIFVEPIFQCMFLGALTSWAVTTLLDCSPLVFFLVHVLVWFLFDYILIKIVQGGPLAMSKFEFLVGWLLNEFSYTYLIVQAHWNPIVVWHNRRYRIRWGGITEEVESPEE